VAALDVTLRLLDYAKLHGITVVCTSLVESADAESEKTAIGISTVADAWMQLAYVNRGGERNRTLTIIKSRGTKHSNQMREMILSNEGVELRDAYSIGGELMLGTARWEKEREDNLAIERSARELAEKRRQQLALKEELNSRQKQAEQELKSRSDLLAMDERHIREQLRQQFNYKADLLVRRGADEELLKLMTIVDHPAFAHNELFRIAEVNDAYLRAAGMERDAVMGKLYWEIFPKQEGPMHSCLHAIESGEYEDEMIVCEDQRKFRSTHQPVRNREGEYRYSLHVLEELDEKESL
jgi:PAS domain-containing protein